MSELEFALKEFKNQVILKTDNELTVARNTTLTQMQSSDNNEPVSFVTIEE